MAPRSQKSKVKATVVDRPSLERDTSTNAVINRNRSDYERRLAHKKHESQKTTEIQSLRSEVEQLKAVVQQLLASSKEAQKLK